jgi:hypothetical protein
MKYGRPVAGAALLVATIGGATAGALLLGTAGADPGAPAGVTTASTAAAPGRCGPVAAAVVDAVGIPAEDVRAARAEGQTLAQLAEANGVDPQVVIDVIVWVRSSRIDLQVARGEINDGQAELRKHRLPEQAAEYVNNPIDPDRVQGRTRGRLVTARAARTIGVPATDLRAAMSEGQSIADVATANGVDPEDVIDELVAHSTQRITAFVNGQTRQGDAGTGTC